MSLTQSAGIRIEIVRDAATRAAWFKVPYRIYRDDPAWIAPLRFVEERRFKPKHPFFAFGEARLFVAFLNGEPVGRISAQINRRHLEVHQDGVGHFGFFDCVDDRAVASALVEAAAGWLAARGLKTMVGPVNFSTNEESGLLIEGFDTPPAILMTHARPWFGGLLEQAGLRKAMDLYAYRMDAKVMPENVLRLAAKAEQGGRVTIRKIDTRRLKAEMELVLDVFNDAWSRNWGFVPFHPREVEAFASDLKLFFRPGYGRIVDIDGQPAAIMLVLPDINGISASFKGRLAPFNWARLLWRLGREDMRGARIPLLGIRRQYQHTPLAAAVLALLVKDFLSEPLAEKLDWVEFSWVLENNKPMNALGRLTAGPPVKTFRIYSMPLDQTGSASL